MPPRRATDISPRLIACDWGDVKTGKTDFALTFPTPIHFFNLNYGIDPLMVGDRHKAKVNDVLIYDFGVSNPGDYDETKSVLARFHDEFLAAIILANTQRGSIVVDTAAELWEMVRVVKLEETRQDRFGKQSKVTDIEQLKNSRLDYGPVNLYMRGMMQRVLHFPHVNAIFLNNCKSKYDEAGRETATKLYSGFNALTAITDVTIRHLKEGKKFYGFIERCRHNTELEGMSLENPTFELVQAHVFG